MGKVRYSIVAPCWNEEENLPELYRRVKDVMSQTGENWELVLINDGSTDRTAELMRGSIRSGLKSAFCGICPKLRSPDRGYGRHGLRPG